MTLDFKNMMYSGCMTARNPNKKITESGVRLAKLRKAAGLSQVQLAALIDIPQRTLSFYETYAENVPSTLVPVLADALGVTVQEILGIQDETETKRGPKSKLDRQFDSVRRLPRKEREFVSKFLDNVLNQTQR
jgi:transcriptional regulator with XRE-family HTH domain